MEGALAIVYHSIQLRVPIVARLQGDGLPLLPLLFRVRVAVKLQGSWGASMPKHSPSVGDEGSRWEEVPRRNFAPELCLGVKFWEADRHTVGSVGRAAKTGSSPVRRLPDMAGKENRRLKELFKEFGVQPATLALMGQMGFTVSTLMNMKDDEVDFIIKSMIEEYHLELLVGEQFGIKAAVRAKRRALDEEMEQQRLDIVARTGDRKISPDDPTSETLLLKDGLGTPRDALGLLGLTDQGSDSENIKVAKKKQKKRRSKEVGEDGQERPREHPFIVTEPGEPAKGKKNGLDYLFDLYEQCGKFLEEVQQIAKEKGEKCPTKVTNEVFRHAKLTGAGYINKPKMRDYVHCYALHCLDMEQSNALRKVYKERGENVGQWCQACYYPLVSLARGNEWDIDDLFNRNEKLRIWYVPTKLRQLCHIERIKHGE